MSCIINADEDPGDPTLTFSEAHEAQKRFVVPEQVWGQRLDKQLALCLPEHSRGRLQGWIEQGHVQVNDQSQTKVRHRVSAGDVLLVNPQPGEETLAYGPESVEFEVVAKSAHWLVVNKPVGLVVHPGAGNWGGTLLNGLLFLDPGLAAVPRAGIVHRLDKDTSGLMVVARTITAQTSLVRQLQARLVHREYVALCHGHLQAARLKVDQPIGRDARVPIKMTVQRPVAPKEAITHVCRQRAGTIGQQRVSEVVCQLQTGRTHQIRVHLASLDHPLLGDVLYGGRSLGEATRQMLHAKKLSFEDPDTGRSQTFECDIPADMSAVMGQIEWQQGQS